MSVAPRARKVGATNILTARNKANDENPNEVVLEKGGRSKYLQLGWENTTNPKCVGIRCAVTSLLDVNINEKKFRANYMMWAKYWADPAPEGYSNVVSFKGKNYRKLSLMVTNVLTEESVSNTWDVVSQEEDAHGRVIVHESRTGTNAVFRLSASDTISNFPIDIHTLMISVLVLPSNPGASDYYFCELSTGMIATMELLRNVEPVSHEWAVYTAEQVHFQNDMGRVFYQLGFKIQRNYEEYLYNGFGLVFMLICMNFTVFATPIDDLATRIIVIVTTSLTIVALKISLSDKMPKSRETNFLDSYINSAIAYSLAFAIAIAVVGSNYRSSHESESADANGAFAGAVVGFWLAVTLRYAFLVNREMQRVSIHSVKVSNEPWVDVQWHDPKDL